MKENNKSNKKELNTCQYAKKCGGCDYQGISYSEQLSQKQKYIEKLMKPFGKVNLCRSGAATLPDSRL